MNNGTYISVQELARTQGVSTQTLYARIKRKTLKAEEIDGKLMVHKTEIDNDDDNEVVKTVDNGLVTQLQSENEYLRTELTQTRLMLKESENRKDILLAQMHEKLELITDRTEPTSWWKTLISGIKKADQGLADRP